MDWKPAKTAPKGEIVLLAWEDGVIRIGTRYADMDHGFMSELDFGDFCSTMYVQRDYLPTHWMPLPAPPTSNLK